MQNTQNFYLNGQIITSTCDWYCRRFWLYVV